MHLPAAFDLLKSIFDKLYHLRLLTPFFPSKRTNYLQTQIVTKRTTGKSWIQIIQLAYDLQAYTEIDLAAFKNWRINIPGGQNERRESKHCNHEVQIIHSCDLK